MAHALIIVNMQTLFLPRVPRRVVGHIRTRIDDAVNQGNPIIATVFCNTTASPYVARLDYHGGIDATDRRLDPHVARNATHVIDTYGYIPDATFFTVLHNLNVDSVTIVGVDTDACVLATALACFDNNLATTVDLRGCYSTGGAALHDATEIILGRNIGAINVIPDVE